MRDVVAVGLPDERFGEVICAVVEPADGRHARPRRRWPTTSRPSLAAYKAPRHLVLVDTIGRAANGKVDYKRLKQVAAERSRRGLKPAARRRRNWPNGRRATGTVPVGHPQLDARGGRRWPARIPADHFHPATGAWMPGDPVGHRRFFTFPADRPFALDGGVTLHDVTLAYETWGALDDSAVERRPAVPRVDGRQPRRRARRPRPSRSPAGGTA